MSEEKILTERFYLHLQKHETLQLAIVEAVQRFFYDNCFDTKTGKMLDSDEARAISNLYQTLSCARPSWRHSLKKRMERYDGNAPTTALVKDAKPKEIARLQIDFKIMMPDALATES